jgi:hypothetical protein
VKFSIARLALEMLLNVENEIDIDDVDRDDESGSGPLLVGRYQFLSVVTVCVERVVERALSRMRSLDWRRRSIIAGGGVGRGFFSSHSARC